MSPAPVPRGVLIDTHVFTEPAKGVICAHPDCHDARAVRAEPDPESLLRIGHWGLGPDGLWRCPLHAKETP